MHVKERAVRANRKLCILKSEKWKKKFNCFGLFLTEILESIWYSFDQNPHCISHHVKYVWINLSLLVTALCHLSIVPAKSKMAAPMLKCKQPLLLEFTVILFALTYIIQDHQPLSPSKTACTAITFNAIHVRSFTFAKSVNLLTGKHSPKPQPGTDKRMHCRSSHTAVWRHSIKSRPWKSINFPMWYVRHTSHLVSGRSLLQQLQCMVSQIVWGPFIKEHVIPRTLKCHLALL